MAPLAPCMVTASQTTMASLAITEANCRRPRSHGVSNAPPQLAGVGRHRDNASKKVNDARRPRRRLAGRAGMAFACACPTPNRAKQGAPHCGASPFLLRRPLQSSAPRALAAAAVRPGTARPRHGRRAPHAPRALAAAAVRLASRPGTACPRRTRRPGPPPPPPSTACHERARPRKRGPVAAFPAGARASGALLRRRRGGGGGREGGARRRGWVTSESPPRETTQGLLKCLS